MTEKSKIERAMAQIEKSQLASPQVGYPNAQKAYEWTPARRAHAEREAGRNMEHNVERLKAYIAINPNCLKKGYKKQIIMDLRMSAHTVNKTLKWIEDNG